MSARLEAREQPVLAPWMIDQVQVCEQRLAMAVSSPGGAKGSVRASPSRGWPDYDYHWVRDAALSMDGVLELWIRTKNPRYLTLLLQNVHFERRTQLAAAAAGNPGIAKFFRDGRVFRDWMNPQDDTWRPITQIRLYRELERQGKFASVLPKLYTRDLKVQSLIKWDLEFAAHNWERPSYELWEEKKGRHFSTALPQRRALVLGAELARELRDPIAAHQYEVQAARLTGDLFRFWDPTVGYLRATLPGAEGVPHKKSDMDFGVVIASLRAEGPDRFMAPDHDYILATAEKCIEDSENRYHVNHAFPVNEQGEWLAPGMGRYPEDRYNGYEVKDGANPWFLLTHYAAKLHYRVAALWTQDGEIKVTALNQPFLARVLKRSAYKPRRGDWLRAGDERYGETLRALVETGDAFLRRSRFHAGSDGSMSEQFSRDILHLMMGAEHLTWSYVSFLDAYWSRQELLIP